MREFTIILPSNSSLKYFPSNTTTNFSTRLPRAVKLHDRWSVGIAEVHVPCTTLHVTREEALLKDPENATQLNYFKHGVYSSISSLIDALNNGVFEYHNGVWGEKFFYDKEGGFVSRIVYKKPDSEEFYVPCGLSEKVKRVLGFEDSYFYFTDLDTPDEFRRIKVLDGGFFQGKQPASLARAVPDQLFIYSNLCEPSIVGDTHAPLLRIVNLDAREFNFGSTIVKRFAPVNYTPLLSNRFQVIDIDIRDQFGNPIPFEFGTLTVALHFKKAN
jgi:hypothetical protein